MMSKHLNITWKEGVDDINLCCKEDIQMAPIYQTLATHFASMIST